MARHFGSITCFRWHRLRNRSPAATLMALVERGQIGLMQRIVDYLPDFDDGSLDDVLIHHLLTHTAGWDTPQFGDQGAAKVYTRRPLPQWLAARVLPAKTASAG